MFIRTFKSINWLVLSGSEEDPVSLIAFFRSTRKEFRIKREKMKNFPIVLAVLTTLIKVVFLINFVEAVNNRSLVDYMCKCQSYESCTWSKNLPLQISLLPQNHPQLVLRPLLPC